MGRALCRVGESLHMIVVRGGQVTLTPVSLWEVHGSDDPASWTYRCTVSGPDVTRLVTLPAASVLHFRYSPHPSRPWAGRSPLALATATAQAAGRLEKATSEELNFTQQQVLTPRRSQNEYGFSRFSHARNDPEDCRRLCRTRPYGRVRDSRRRASAAIRAGTPRLIPAVA